MPTEWRVFVEVHVRQRLDDGQEVEHRLIKRLDEPFWQMPVPGDEVRLAARDEKIERQGTNPDGTINTLTTWEGGMVQAQLSVLRRMWIPEGVLLVCEPYSPVESAMDSAKLLEAYSQLGFEAVSSGPAGPNPAF